MKKYTISLLTLVLLLTACGQGTPSFTVDSTRPVSDANRIIYQLNVGAFTPEGTFKAAEGQLARLDTLGIDILWLMPIYPRGVTMHSPYASMNFYDVNPAYGTVGDLKAFVAAAHEHGMKVWLDWVPNHVAVENPWVTEHPEYFTKDAKGQMIHPHGWGDVFELNYQDAGLVSQMSGAMKFWVDSCDVDGFRCDYVSSPTIPVSYWQNIIAELKSKSGKTVEFLSETDITNPENIRIDSCGFDYDYAWDFQGTLAWKFKNSSNADTLKTICEDFLTASKQVKNRRMVYLTNHDQNYNDGGHTLKDFYGDNRYALTVLQFTFYGMPLIYQGQEIGDPDTLNYFTDAKVKWLQVDRRMQNTVRTLCALHHTQPSLAADAPIEFLETDNPSVLAYQRGPVVVIINLSTESCSVDCNIISAGNYTQWLNSKTIADGPSVTDVTLDTEASIEPDAKGFVVYVKQ
jgi:1,4-alpha-glucan branching enzyme